MGFSLFSCFLCISQSLITTHYHLYHHRHYNIWRIRRRHNPHVFSVFFSHARTNRNIGHQMGLVYSAAFFPSLSFSLALPLSLPLSTVTCPPRFISRFSACATTSSVPFMMYVVTFCRPTGGLNIVLRSRMPVRDMCSVRGIGVAVSVKTSTPVANTLMFVFDVQHRYQDTRRGKEGSGRGVQSRTGRVDVSEYPLRFNGTLLRTRSRPPKTTRFAWFIELEYMGVAVLLTILLLNHKIRTGRRKVTLYVL